VGPEDVSVRQTLEALAYQRCYVITLYKSTFTYLLTFRQLDSHIQYNQRDNYKVFDGEPEIGMPLSENIAVTLTYMTF